MKRIMVWAGCLLAAATGAPASASSPDEGAAPASDAAAVQTRFHLYGVSYRRAGERFTYLGAFDAAKDARAAGKLACDGGPRYQEYCVVEGVELVLPPSKAAYETRSIEIYRLSHHDHGERLVGRYPSMREAAAAAEKVLADGDSFQVIYSWD